MSPVAWLSVCIVGVFVGCIVGEAVLAVLRERRDAAIRKYRDEGFDHGFREGADLDDKARRIGERARRFQR